MRPVRTALCTAVDIGPIGASVPPLPYWTETNDHGVTARFTVWELTPGERERIAAGGNVLVGVFADPAPTTSLGVVEGDGFTNIGGVDSFGVDEAEA